MMTATQAQALELMAKVLTLDPEIRIGQLVDWVALMARPEQMQPTSNIEDEEFVEACSEHLANLERAAAARAEAAASKSLLTTDH